MSRIFAAVAATFLSASAPAAQSDALVAPGAEIEKEDFFKPGIAPQIAPRGYNLTIVYFMDYACPQCRRYTPDVERVMREDRRVRWIYRDIPSISSKSRDAARSAIAAQWQNRHHAFHRALMMTPGRLSDATIRAAAGKAGLNWAKLQRDIKLRGKDIDRQIERNIELADAAGMPGTPAFIIGERQSNGALDYAGLKAEIADARRELRTR
ncbi:thioredoxin domain-containing protein [Sphingomonas sp. HDW15A]|uniref:thioredoxin domain-containing protein n=1 Tax=Sphingomonas sp. HDW15A TaxID=2714942 RepID=UPI0014098E9B|nr:thioredoxin domain-containing protein [Sphingomonas sp. HDW15A]QIK96417.1 thioredoxin domain-containing protein [Sphingomonas sp. HDW15A]